MKTLGKHSPNLKMQSSSKNKKLKKNSSLKKLNKNMMSMKEEEMMSLLKVKRKKLCSRKRSPVLMNLTVMLQTQ
jgi:hypothetical protein